MGDGTIPWPLKNNHGCIARVFVARWYTMSTKVIAQELAAVKQRLAALEARLKPGPKLAWQEIIGTAEGDDLDRAAARLGAAWRKRENKRR